MSALDSLKTVATRQLGRTSFALKKRSPELLMAAGVGAIVTSGVLLVKATMKVQPILDDHEERLSDAKSALITPTYSDSDLNRDVTKVYVRTGLNLAKHYGPSVTVGTAGVVALLASNGILRRRNVALAAAFQAAEAGFRDYRDRVSEEIGEEREEQIYQGVREIEEIDSETGAVTKRKTYDPVQVSVYAKFFDEYSPFWKKNAEYNLIFLHSKMAYFNDLLNARGHVFLNEVYRELGIEETQVGQVAGWTRNGGDGYIDFGMYDLDSPEARAFVNGLERSIRLDFNVDGAIMHMVREN